MDELDAFLSSQADEGLRPSFFAFLFASLAWFWSHHLVVVWTPSTVMVSLTVGVFYGAAVWAERSSDHPLLPLGCGLFVALVLGIFLGFPALVICPILATFFRFLQQFVCALSSHDQPSKPWSFTAHLFIAATFLVVFFHASTSLSGSMS